VAFGQSEPLERGEVAAAEDGRIPLNTYPASCRQNQTMHSLPSVCV
jgi:hypothetical protein